MIKPEHIVAVDVAPEDVKAARSRRHDRSAGDRPQDALTGRAAALGWLRYLQSASIACRLWDDIRRDDAHDAAPLDGFVAQPGEAAFLAGPVFADIACQWQEGARFRRGFFAACERRGIFGFRIEATRIAPRHIFGGQVSYAAILEDDFLACPPLPAGALDDSTRRDLISQQQRAAAAEQMPYLLARACVDVSRAAWRVYLIGYMTRPQFFQSPHLRVTAIPQPNSAERVICYAVPLRLGRSLAELRRELGV